MKTNDSKLQKQTSAAAMNRTQIELHMTEAQSRLGRQRQNLVRSIVDHCEETCFLSSRQLAKRFNVDAATIVRTVQALGYKGFADFSLDLRDHFLTRVTPYTVLKATARQGRSVEDNINHSLNKAVDNLNLLRSDLSRPGLIELAALIHRSRKILVVGVDLAASLAYHLAYGLVVLGIDAEAPVGSEGNLQHKVKRLTKKDLLIAISFGQCLRVTVEAAIRARQLGVQTFGITDGDTTPIARHTDRHLIAATASPSFFLSSYAAPMALISALHDACAHLKPKRSLHQLKTTEKDYLSGSRWYRESRNKAD